ncbi:hypothetical protein [Paenibacillus thermotolerans]|uniref:hypothetical protein n=1 Tax=Paenibacillus thermotolerans TaxID=3027807 RepID=UPI002368178E|nr:MULTISPECIES: hypothetical protein [unclassified Paenibacillus]
MRIFLIIVILVLSACNSREIVQDWEMKVRDKPIVIAYAGERPGIEAEGVTFISLQESGLEFESLWVDESQFDNFTSDAGIEKIKEWLSEGKVVVFITGKNVYETLAPRLGITDYEQSIERTAFQHG